LTLLPVATKTVIVGAGPAGLAVAGCLSKLGEPFELLERREAVGASFRGHYRRLHLHTDKALSSLPHVPFAASLPTWVPRADVVDYLDDYARHFRLRPHFGVSLHRVERTLTGLVVTTDRGSLEAQNVVVATGYNRVPVRPSFDGLEQFTGPVCHSSEYVDGAPYQGKRVLVVGAGNSGAEIALDLWEHGAHPRLLVRGPIHVVPRALFGVPVQRVSVGLRFLSAELVDKLSAPLTSLLVGDLTPFGLRAPSKGAAVTVRDEGRIPLVDVGTVALIRQGLLPVLPGIARFEATSVTCVDGRSHPIDAVVLATGYRSGLSDLVDRELLDDRDHPRAHGTRVGSGLFFLGFSNPQTGALREIAIEATRIAEQIHRGRS
jgi:cation diffusion facilitator CzcD-associated flavoprotein CzcO